MQRASREVGRHTGWPPPPAGAGAAGLASVTVGIPAIGIALFLAMVVTMAAAGLMGAAVPLFLKAARLDPALEALADSATPERDRGNVADIAFVRDFRRTVAAKVRTRIELIDAGDVGAPTQMRSIGSVLLTALINHEYQHDRWIGEVRHDALGHHLPELPSSPHLTNLDGYLVITS